MTLFGVLNVNKPAGVTSRRVVDRIERILLPTKVGHAGTLDPLATGVLVICVGQATRLVPYVQQMRKMYVAGFRLGYHSETDDIEAPLEPVVGAVEPSRAEVERVLASFVGKIEQRPPAHSAVKLSGKRAYKLARRGVTFEIQPKTVAIYRIALRRYEYPELEIEVECGSGTYVRSLGRDVGDALGTGAVMTALERKAVGNFQLCDGIAIDDLSAESIQRNLQPAAVAVAELRHVRLTAGQALEVRHGRPILTAWLSEPVELASGEEVAALDPADQLAAILFEKAPGELWTRMSFTKSPSR